MPLQLGKEPFHNPTPVVAPQASAILRLWLGAVGFVRRNHFDPLLSQFLVQWVSVIGAIANQALGFRLDHVEIKTQLHQGDFLMIGGMRADRERQTVAIHNRHDFHAFSAFCRSDLIASALGRGECGINKRFAFV